MSSFKVEVQTDSSGRWYGNAMRYDTEELAKAQADDLAGRWMLVREWRVTPCDDEPNYTMGADGGLVSIALAKRQSTD